MLKGAELPGKAIPWWQQSDKGSCAVGAALRKADAKAGSGDWSLSSCPSSFCLLLLAVPPVSLRDKSDFSEGNGCVCSGWAARDGWLGAASWVCILGAILTRGAILLDSVSRI